MIKNLKQLVIGTLVILVVVFIYLISRYDNFTNNYESDKKYAVVICTYKRKDGSTKEILKKLSQSLNSQTYKNFTIFLNGDDYEDKKEFNDFSKLFKNNVISENYPISFREGYFTINKNKWSTGGLNANYNGIVKAKNMGYKYYLHLDDDEVWEKDFIEQYDKTIKQYPDADFLFCKSRYKDSFLPRNSNDAKKLFYNNLLPEPTNIVHSTFCINLNTIGNDILDKKKEILDTINKIKEKRIKEYYIQPVDKQIVILINKKIKSKKYKTVFINKTLCSKETDVNIPK